MQSVKQSASGEECLQPRFLCLYPSRRHIFHCLKVFQHLPTFADTFWAIRLSVPLYSPFYSHYHVNSTSAAFQAARGGEDSGFFLVFFKAERGLSKVKFTANKNIKKTKKQKKSLLANDSIKRSQRFQTNCCRSEIKSITNGEINKTHRTKRK